jgi:hypothetical protein
MGNTGPPRRAEQTLGNVRAATARRSVRTGSAYALIDSASVGGRPAIQCEASWALRCVRAWWIVVDGFELTLLVWSPGWADLRRWCRSIAVKDVLDFPRFGGHLI